MLALTLLRSSKSEDVVDGIELARRLIEPTDESTPELVGPSIRAGLANSMAFALVRWPMPNLAQLVEADRWAAMACELRPGTPSPIATLGLVRIRQGRFQEAEELVRPLIATAATEGERANCETTLALALASSGRINEASELVARARTVHSDSPILVEAEALVQTSDCE
jgi:hypothetical protein